MVGLIVLYNQAEKMISLIVWGKLYIFVVLDLLIVVEWFPSCQQSVGMLSCAEHENVWKKTNHRFYFCDSECDMGTGLYVRLVFMYVMVTAVVLVLHGGFQPVVQKVLSSSTCVSNRWQISEWFKYCHLITFDCSFIW